MKYLFFIIGIIFSFSKLYSQDDPFQIAQNNIKARGGNKMLSGVYAVKMDVILNQKGKDQKATIYIINNQAYRYEFKDNPSNNEFILVTKTGGIHSKTNNKTEDVKLLTNQEVESYFQKMDIFGPLMNAREKNINLMFLQYEDYNKMKCKVIAFPDEVNHSPEPTKIYISENDLVIKMEENLDTDNGKKTVVTEYSNYKPAKNMAVLFPYKVSKDGTTMIVEELIVNPELSTKKMNLEELELLEFAKRK